MQIPDDVLTEMARSHLGKRVLVGGDEILRAMRAAYSLGHSDGEIRGIQDTYEPARAEGFREGQAEGLHYGYALAVKQSRAAKIVLD